MPRPSKIDLDDAEIGAVVLVPLDNHPARHARRLERHDLVEMVGRDDHAARVLAQVARQVDHRGRDLGQQLRAAIGRGEAGLGDEGRERCAVVHDPAGQVLGDARELLLGEAERAAGVAHRHARAIGDHVRGHGGAARAVLGVDVLDHLLAAIARRQIEIDVGHAVGDVAGALHALLGEKALEQQVHRHRIDRGDAEDVAGGRVRRRAAPLDHDAAPARVLDDVPHDQEVAGELELADDRQLARDLLAHLRQEALGPRVAGRIAAPDAEPGHLLEVALLRFTGRHGITGEGVAEVGERECAALGDGARRAQRRRAIGEQRRHLGGRLEPALAVGRQAAADLVDGGAGARAGEHVVDPLLRRRGVADVVGGDDADPVRGRLRLGGARAVRLGCLQVALRLEEDVASTERVDERR